jgi:hypothetical protein
MSVRIERVRRRSKPQARPTGGAATAIGNGRALLYDIDARSHSAKRYQKANNPQQSWGFEGEPPEAVTKDFGTRDGTS